MVAQPGTYQASFNAGEISEDVLGNTGLKAYFVAAERMVNAEPVPQGGFDNLPGSWLRGRVRRALSAVFTATSQTSAATTVAGTVLTYAFPAAVLVSAIDLGGLSATLAQAGDILVAEVQLADSSWVQIGGALALPLVASAASWRLAFVPGHGVSATHLRLRLISAPSGSLTVTLVSLTVLAEATTGVPAHRIRPFVVDRSTAYAAVYTAGHVDFWLDDGAAFPFAGCCSQPLTEDQIAAAKIVQRGETGLLFHKDLQTRRILRRSAHWKWSIESTVFDPIPQVDYGGTYTKVSEVWNIYLKWTSLTINGQTITITVDGEATDGIPIVASTVADWTTTAASIKAAIEALPNVEPGVTVTVSGTPSVSTTGSANLVLTFTGDGNSGNRYSVGGDFTSSTSGALSTWRKTKGDPGGEDAISAARGWAACGFFYQDRLWQAGLKAKPGAIMASRTAEYFDLNIELDTASAAMLYNIDTSGGDAVIQLAEGRHLVIFTTGGSYFLPNRTSSSQDAPNPVFNSSDSCSEVVPVVDNEGELMFVNGEGGMVLAAAFDDVRQGYVPEPISLLSSHLILTPVDGTLQPASTDTDAARFYLVLPDGRMVVAVLIRGQEVTGFVQRVTPGAFRSVACVNRQRVWTVVERDVDGVATAFVEVFDPDQLLDCAIRQTSETPETVWAGLDAHEGAEVWALADGFVDGPFTVSGGAITLPFASRDVTVGRWTAVDVITVALARDVGGRQVLMRPGRIHTVRARVIETTSIAIGANDMAPRDVPLGRFGQPVDEPVPPYTGRIVAAGLKGFADDVKARFTQKRPGVIRIRDITMEARL